MSPSKATDRDRTAAVVVAAGASRRMDGVDKVFAPVAGRPLVAHAIQVLEDSPGITDIIVVMAAANVSRGRGLAAAEGWRKVRDVIAGGTRRQDSVRNGLAAVTESDWVVIHDGARPCVDTATLERGLAAARETGAAIAAVPVKDTIKVVDSRNTVVTTPSRDTLWAVQTPQVFRTRLLIEAHDAVRDDVTDDASMVERNGGVVKVFMGSYDNIKVTTPEDLAIAEAFLSRKTRPVAGRAR